MATWVDYANTLQNIHDAQTLNTLRQQKAQQDLLTFQQAQQDRQRQMAAQASLGNTFGQLYPGGQVAQVQTPPPQGPAPQPPAPGQPSQPMQQAGGGVRPPLPAGGVPAVAGQGPQNPLPPFRPMPTTPPQAQAAQQGGLSLERLAKLGKDQGLSGMELFTYLKEATPLLDYDSQLQLRKAELQFNHEIQLQRLEDLRIYREGQGERAETRAEETARHNRATEATGAGNLGARREGNVIRAEAAGVDLPPGTPGAGGGAPPLPSGAPGAAPAAPEKLGADGLPLPVAGGGLTADAVRKLSEAWVAGEKLVLRGQTASARRTVMNDVAKISPGGGGDLAASAIDYAAASKGAQTAVQREANIATSLEAITAPNGLADQVLDAAKKTYRTGSPFVNQKLNYVMANYGGDPAVVDLKNALGDLEGQFNKAMAGGGAATDSARAETIARINDAQTLPQLEAAVNRMKLGLRTEHEAAEKVSKQFSNRVRNAGKSVESAAKAPAIPQGWSVTEH